MASAEPSQPDLAPNTGAGVTQQPAPEAPVAAAQDQKHTALAPAQASTEAPKAEGGAQQGENQAKKEDANGESGDDALGALAEAAAVVSDKPGQGGQNQQNNPKKRLREEEEGEEVQNEQGAGQGGIQPQINMNPVPTPLPQPVVLPQFEYPQAYDGRVAQDREKFETMLNLLKEYVSEYRDLPLQRTTYKGKNLGVWVMHRKQNYWKGRLSDRDARMLEEVPGWKWEPDFEFDHMMKLLREYTEANGQLPEYQTVTYRGTSLGTWIKHRRQDYALGRLNPDWARQLEALPGWTWGQEEGRHVRPKSRADFTYMLNLLKDYVNKYGKLPTHRSTYMDQNIGIWCTDRRQEFKKGKLSESRAAALESVPGWSWERRGKRGNSDVPLPRLPLLPNMAQLQLLGGLGGGIFNLASLAPGLVTGALPQGSKPGEMMGINQLSLHALMMNQAALNSLTAGILPQATAAPTAQQGGDDASGAQQGGDAAAGVQPGADAAASAAANAIPLQAAIPTLTSQQLQQLLASHQLVLPGLQAGIPGISAAASQPLGSALPLSLPISTLGASGGLPVSFPIISTGLPTLGTSVPQDTTAVAASAPTGAEAADPTAASAASAPATLGASTQAQGLPLMIGLGGLPALGAAGTDVTGIPQPMEGMAQLGGGASAAQQLGIGVLGQAAQQGDAAAGQGVTIAGLPALMPQVLGGLPLGTAALSAGDAAAPVAAAPAALPVLDAGAVAAASLPLPASLPEAIATPAPQADSAPAPGPAAESAAPSGAPTAE